MVVQCSYLMVHLTGMQELPSLPMDFNYPSINWTRFSTSSFINYLVQILPSQFFLKVMMQNPSNVMITHSELSNSALDKLIAFCIIEIICMYQTYILNTVLTWNSVCLAGFESMPSQFFTSILLDINSISQIISSALEYQVRLISHSLCNTSLKSVYPRIVWFCAIVFNFYLVFQTLR